MPWERDFFDIDLNSVSIPELPIGWERTKSYSRQQIQGWIQNLRILQANRPGSTYTVQEIEQMRASPDQQMRQLGETAHHFYNHDTHGPGMNSDHVDVEWRGDRYAINNGQHRISLAKELGLQTIPATVSAPNRATLELLRADGRARMEGASPNRQGVPAPWQQERENAQSRREIWEKPSEAQRDVTRER